MSEDLNIIVSCPHCGKFIIINKNEINCAIFRHGVFINNFEQMNPHTPKEECDRLFDNNQIFGCGKPFKLINENNEYSAVICDYI